MNGIIYTAVNCIETRQCGGKNLQSSNYPADFCFFNAHSSQNLKHQFLKIRNAFRKSSKILSLSVCFSNWVMTYRNELYTRVYFISISYTFLPLSVKTSLFSSPK